MSKIMKAIFAEARAAREKATDERRRPTEGSAPGQGLSSSIEWWKAQYELSGRAAVSEVAFAAIKAIEHPCRPADHIAWWARTSNRQPWNLP